MPQLSWVLGEPGGLGTGDRSGLEPAKRGQVTLAQSGRGLVAGLQAWYWEVLHQSLPGQNKDHSAEGGRLAGEDRKETEVGEG